MITRYRYAEKRSMNEHDMKILEMALLIGFLSIATFCGSLTIAQFIKGNPSYELGIIFFGCTSLLLIYYFVRTLKKWPLLLSILGILVTIYYLFLYI